MFWTLQFLHIQVSEWIVVNQLETVTCENIWQFLVGPSHRGLKTTTQQPPKQEDPNLTETHYIELFVKEKRYEYEVFGEYIHWRTDMSTYQRSLQ